MTARDAISALQAAMNAEVLGQPVVVERMILGLLADGHLLIEGLPGLAKTRAVKAMARHLEGRFQPRPVHPGSAALGRHRYGHLLFLSRQGEFRFQPGPVFGNILLADEINRAPAKVQAALLEAMEERQVTVGTSTYPLPDLFIVMATQNPIEQEGTYPLPEAQTDRFLMHVLRRLSRPGRRARRPAPAAGRGTGGAGGPARDCRRQRQRRRKPATIAIEHVFARPGARSRRCMCARCDRGPSSSHLVNATRTPSNYSEDLGRQTRARRQPAGGDRADRCARAYAWLQGSDFVSPGDVHAIAPDVLRHRIALSYEAKGAGRDADAVLADLLKLVAPA